MTVKLDFDLDFDTESSVSEKSVLPLSTASRDARYHAMNPG